MAGRNVVEAIKSDAIAEANRRYASIQKIAVHLVKRFPASGTIMTQCFAETIVGMMLKEAKLAGKQVRLFCPETRPYFQGARLTATVCRDMGFDGKTLIHPSQVDPCNEVFSPSADEVARARAMIAAYTQALAEGRGVATLDGQMVEVLHVEQAKRLLARA